MWDPSCNIHCDGELNIDLSFDGEFGAYHRASSYDSYDGAYEVSPKFEKQTLGTKDKLMLENVTVEAITVSRVSNPAGGHTVFIGGQINYGE